MDVKDTSDDIEDHGTIFDRKSNTIRCNYCFELINGFHRLRFHLGGIRGEERPCPEVPASVKEFYQNEVLKKRKYHNLKREMLWLDSPKELPLKRNCSQRSSFKQIRHESGGLIEFSAMKFPSFREIMYSTIRISRLEFMSYDDLKGPVPVVELTEMQDYVRRIKQSWLTTGCSILLDTWKDEQGRDLVIFLAECPQGSVYIKSSDISSFTDDIDALQMILNKVIGEVGAQNVVQIVACSTAGWLRPVAEQFMDKCRTWFWTVSASHCINLMLENLGMMDLVKPILEKAVHLTNFTLKDSNPLLDLRDPCFKGNSAAISFMTLENILAEKERLEAVVTSSEFVASSWASTEEGKMVHDLVRDPSFWNGVKMVLKASVPLLHLLALIHKADKQLMGYIYEAMDQVKEAIRKEFKEKKSQYWKIIDEIWNDYLHTPLHAAGYYLNPNLFYSSNFYMDMEVAHGLICCIVRLLHDEKTRDFIAMQIDQY